MKTPTHPASPWATDPLAATDPELAEYFENFAFEEVPRRSSMAPETRLMVQLAAAIAAQGLSQFRALSGAALAAGVTPVEIKEIVYQSVPYVGMAKALDFIHASNEVLSSHGIELPLPGQSTTTPENRAEAGVAVQTLIVGADRKAAMQAAAPADQQHIQRLLEANCFGDHYTRTGLDVPTRELLTFATLVALGGCEPQVAGHVAANLTVGNTRAMLVDTLTQLLPFIGYPRTLNGLRIVNEGTQLS